MSHLSESWLTNSTQTFWDLHSYSVTHRSQFWAELFDSARFIHSGAYTTVVDERLPINAVPRWFEGVYLNFAENVLYSRNAGEEGADPGRRGTAGKEDGKIAVTEVREGASATQHVAWRELRRRAGDLARAMKAKGIRKGDRVIVVAANSVDTLLVLLAACWLGAVFSSSSTDMGVQGILQRTVQVNPKVGSMLLAVQ